MKRLLPSTSALTLLALVLACASASEESMPASDGDSSMQPPCPIAGGTSTDELIRAGEDHFVHLWRLTFDGENAEGYWNPAGDRLSFQRRWEGVDCDRIFVTEPPTPGGEFFRQISNGKGTTTCAYFMPDGTSVLFGSTQAIDDDCPPKPDMSLGYGWAIYPHFDIYVRDLATGAERPVISGPGYDAEPTVSPQGDRIVFTSTRSGDLELWTCDLEGGDLVQVTDAVGYDGGAFFSSDGEWLVFRTTFFDETQLAEEHERYKQLLEKDLVRPHSMEIMMIHPDGSERHQVTHLGKANWAPYFYPGDERILFSTNHHSIEDGPMNFDLFAIDVNGENLERITFEDSFDSFPMFSPDGRYLVFASNRGGAHPTDTNLFVAEWRD